MSGKIKQHGHRSSGSFWILAAVAIAGVVGGYLCANNAFVSRDSVEAPVEATVQPLLLSPYEKYKSSAIKNGWTPVDPVEKLGSTIAKMGQVLDPKDLKRSNEFLKMLMQEFHYVLNVLANTPDITFDLSHLMLEALDMVRIAYFKSTKHLLWAGSKTATRAAVDREAADMQLLFAALKKSVLTLAEPIATRNNIIFDINRYRHRGQSPLMQAVQSRMYPMIAWLLMHGGSALLDGPLHEAVLNGDITAVHMLLEDPGFSATDHAAISRAREVLSSCRNLAFSLKYQSVERLISRKLDSMIPSKSGLPNFVSESGNEFFGTNDLGCHPSTSAEISVGDAPSIQVTVPCPERSAALSDMEKAYEDSTDFDIRHRCDIPIRYFNTDDNDLLIDKYDSLTLMEFQQDFVEKNQPVLLRGLLSGSGASEWTFDNLINNSGEIEVQTGRIPYEPLFEGDKEKVLLSIREYIQSAETHNNEILAWLRNAGLSNGNEVLLDLFGGLVVASNNTAVPLPEYVFDNQILGRRGHVKVFDSLFRGIAERRAADKKTFRLFERSLRWLVSAISAGGNETDTEMSGSQTTGQFFIGPLFSGAPFHHHGPALNVLVHGRKLWLMLPPGRDLYSKLHPLAWAHGLRSSVQQSTTAPKLPAYAEYYPYFKDGSPCSLIQEEGDVLFVPRHWSHQILNLDNMNLGFAIEIH